jgi:hypothetical protein
MVRRMRKKGQLEMMQTAFVLLILFVVFTLALIFFIGYQKTGIRSKEKEMQGLEIIKRAQVLNFLPELQCSFDGVVYPNCYDKVKIEKFNEYVQGSEVFYDSLLGDVRIVIAQYKSKKAERGWAEDWLEYEPGGDLSGRKVMFDNRNEEKKDTRMIQMPVSIYDPVENIYSLGVIYLEISQ